MKFAAVLVVAFACSSAFASEPGQPLDCGDWVVLDPGISCRELRPCGTEPTNGQNDFPCSGLMGSNIDALGRVVDFELTETVVCSGSRPPNLELKFFDGASEHLVAYVRGRCVAAACSDGVELRGRAVDPMHGRVFASIRQRSYNCDGADYDHNTLFAFEGFPTTLEILQSFTPQASLGFRVPYMPEGMAAADSFDTYWGNLTKPIDFTQAHPLACDYPAAPPHVGDYLTVADTVPTPVPGQGVYYVTAATYQGQTRYGRKTTAGHLSGRDPALLPACALRSLNP